MCSIYEEGRGAICDMMNGGLCITLCCYSIVLGDWEYNDADIV